MKENVFDVLIYLFENYLASDDTQRSTDPDSIRTELLDVGFPQPEVNKAFDWLETLSDPQTVRTSQTVFRMYADSELAKLDTECRGLLLELELSGILNNTSRELVIDRVMALSDESISLDNLKWIVLMVLFTCPEEATAFARMENLVYDQIPNYMH